MTTLIEAAASRGGTGDSRWCYAATGNGFVNITLDVPDPLNIRHPHRHHEPNSD